MAYLPEEWREGQPEDRQKRSGYRYSVDMRDKVRRMIAAGADYETVLARTPFNRRDVLRNFCVRHQIPLPSDAKPWRADQEIIENIRVLLNVERMSFKQIALVLEWGGELGRSRVSGLVFRYGLNGMMRRPERFVTVYGNKVSHKHRRGEAQYRNF